MVSRASRDHAQSFMWHNARLLERQLFAALFAGGPRAPVLAALRAYQNADGGFGNGLEPDKRTPHSQPVDAEMALRVLDAVGFDAPMVTALCDFLTTITTAAGGVPFVLPSVRAYPRAAWWDGPDDPPASLNPTAALVGLLHKHHVAHPWLDRATAYCWRALDASPLEEVHELLCVITFLEHAPDQPRAAAAGQRVADRLLGGGLVELDPAATGYVKKPLEWAPRPDSLCRPLFADAVIAAHLDALAGQQAEDGSWPVSWPTISPLVELEWRGWLTIAALRTLRAYGRLADGS